MTAEYTERNGKTPRYLIATDLLSISLTSRVGSFSTRHGVSKIIVARFEGVYGAHTGSP